MLIRNIALACTLFCAAAGGAYAAGEPPFVSGGVGMEERGQMLATRADYNLHLTFANRGSGEFRSDVQVAITDTKGNVSLHARDAGPLMYVKLDPGRYRVEVSAEGQSQRKDVVVQAGRSKDLYFYWRDDEPIIQ